MRLFILIILFFGANSLFGQVDSLHCIEHQLWFFPSKYKYVDFNDTCKACEGCESVFIQDSISRTKYSENEWTGPSRSYGGCVALRKIQSIFILDSLVSSEFSKLNTKQMARLSLSPSMWIKYVDEQTEKHMENNMLSNIGFALEELDFVISLYNKRLEEIRLIK